MYRFFMKLADKNFQNTGLERSAALAADIAWFKEAYVRAPTPTPPDQAFPKLLCPRLLGPRTWMA